MSERKRKQSYRSLQLDSKVEQAIEVLIKKHEFVSARAIASMLDVAPSTITRSAKRAKLVVEAKRYQLSLKATMKNQLNSSRKSDAKHIARQAATIEKLKKQNHALLISHRALYDVIRESGDHATWNRFLATALEIQEDLMIMGAINNEDSS